MLFPARMVLFFVHRTQKGEISNSYFIFNDSLWLLSSKKTKKHRPNISLLTQNDLKLCTSHLNNFYDACLLKDGDR